MEYEFTNDWFGNTGTIWQEIIPHMEERKKILEVGSYEGRSTVWMAENIVEDGGKILCIDTWEGGEEHDKEVMGEVEQRFHKNISIARTKFPNRAIYSFRSKSSEILGTMNSSPRDIGTYDFIYIDGSHQAKDVLTDACMAWPLLKIKGFMAFDDYLWGPRGFSTIHRPKIALDLFTTVLEEELAIVHIGYQIIVRKMK